MKNPFMTSWDRICSYCSRKMHAFICWFIFLLITEIIVGVVLFMVKDIDHKGKEKSTDTVVRIYLNEQDSIVPIIQEGIESLSNQIREAKIDSVAVKVVRAKENE